MKHRLIASNQLPIHHLLRGSQEKSFPKEGIEIQEEVCFHRDKTLLQVVQLDY